MCLTESSLVNVGYVLPIFGSVGDPDPEPNPDPQDPHVFGPPGSGSIPDPLEVRIRILPFSQKCVKMSEIMPAK